MEIMETIAIAIYVVAGVCLLAVAYFELVSYPWQQGLIAPLPALFTRVSPLLLFHRYRYTACRRLLSEQLMQHARRIAPLAVHISNFLPDLAAHFVHMLKGPAMSQQNSWIGVRIIRLSLRSRRLRRSSLIRFDIRPPTLAGKSLISSQWSISIMAASQQVISSVNVSIVTGKVQTTAARSSIVFLILAVSGDSMAHAPIIPKFPELPDRFPALP